MSYKVAICDDEICTCKNLEEMLRKAFMSVGVSANIDVFYSGEKIVQYLKYGNTYDFIFLDEQATHTFTCGGCGTSYDYSYNEVRTCNERHSACGGTKTNLCSR